MKLVLVVETQDEASTVTTDNDMGLTSFQRLTLLLMAMDFEIVDVHKLVSE